MDKEKMATQYGNCLRETYKNHGNFSHGFWPLSLGLIQDLLSMKKCSVVFHLTPCDEVHFLLL